jgi:hypothetical protein
MPCTLGQAFGRSYLGVEEPVTISKEEAPEQKKTTQTPNSGYFRPEEYNIQQYVSVGATQDENEPKREKKNSKKHGMKSGDNYIIQININRDDCHLMCLFMSVFILAFLFSGRKK